VLALLILHALVIMSTMKRFSSISSKLFIKPAGMDFIYLACHSHWEVVLWYCICIVTGIDLHQSFSGFLFVIFSDTVLKTGYGLSFHVFYLLLPLSPLAWHQARFREVSYLSCTFLSYRFGGLLQSHVISFWDIKYKDYEKMLMFWKVSVAEQSYILILTLRSPINRSLHILFLWLYRWLN
jgi:hypothetical protein